MHIRRIAVCILVVIVAMVVWTSFPLRAQVLTARAQDVRFELVSNEPIAAPDNRSVVAGWSATVIRDRRTGKCFVAVTEGDSVSLAPADCR